MTPSLTSTLAAAALIAVPAAAQIGQFCAGINSDNCGANVAASGNIREFDLSPLCLNDGTFYYDEDNAGHQYVTNVCGKLADECQVQQYCQTTNDITGPTLPTGSDPICLNNELTVREGQLKQYGFSQDCEDALGNTSPLTPSCSKCSMMAKEPTAAGDARGTWGPIIENGQTLELSAGVQVTWPAIPMDSIASTHAWGACASPQTGWQATTIFYCDCDQISYENKDIFDQNNNLGVFLGQFGNLNANLDAEGNVAAQYNCMYTTKFKHRDACYKDYCESGAGGSSSGGGMGGGSKFLIVASVFAFVYLAAACFCGIKRNKETGEVGENRFCPDIALGTTVMWEFVTCKSGAGSSYSSGAGVPGQDAYSSNTELRGGGSASYSDKTTVNNL